MQKLFSWLLAGALIVSVCAFATAEDKEKKKGEKKKADPEAVFKKLDKDGDGSLTKEELTGKRKNKEAVEKMFARIDKDKDGKISLEEFKAPRGKKGGKKGAKKDGAKKDGAKKDGAKKDGDK